MSKQYDQYLKDHINGVHEAFVWLKKNLPNLLSADLVSSDRMEDIIKSHDMSKYSNHEYDAYDKYFYSKHTSKEIETEFNKAWLHHIHVNPHHWQHWILIEDDPQSDKNICIEIPYQFIIEMICDWWSFSFRKNNLHEIFTWYDSHKNHIQLHPASRKIVENILDKIKSKLEELEK